MFRFFKVRKWFLWAWAGSFAILSSLWIQVQIEDDGNTPELVLLDVLLTHTPCRNFGTTDFGKQRIATE